MKRRERTHNTELQRLVDATALYARQQWERVYFGNEEEYDEVLRENRHVINKVLPVIEQMLDEDLLEQLDRGSYTSTTSAALTPPNPFMPSTWGLPPTPWSWPPGPAWGAPGPAWGTPPRFRRPSAFSARPVRLSSRPSSEQRVTMLLDQILEDFRTDVLERLRKARREDRTLNDTDLDELVKDLREELNLVARRSKQRKERLEEEDNET
jgi:hypothetical protein